MDVFLSNRIPQPNEPIGATGCPQYRQALSKGFVFENSIFGIFCQSKPVKECITVCNFLRAKSEGFNEPNKSTISVI